ncbi:phosphate ABC transporter permease PstA [Pantoea sp. 1.19]|uniref:phosphate ABC transporter permease PstA n=1 Tax=Pantoea sp. 1.19 TaxID=1925589 RepID=UPI000948D33D|nr:phosphate ABC transporter permease PstA [Pantoea sp. 1.19]
MSHAQRQNRRWRWLTAGAVAFSLLAFTLLIALLAWQGLRYFWPQPLTLFTLSDGRGALLGEVVSDRILSREALAQRGMTLPAGVQAQRRFVIHVGGDAQRAPGSAFRSLTADDIVSRQRPADALALQRRSVGMSWGWLSGLEEQGQPLVAGDLQATLRHRLAQADASVRQADRLRRVTLARLNDRLERLETDRTRRQSTGRFDAEAQSRYRADRAALTRQFSRLSDRLRMLTAESERTRLVLRDADGQLQRIPLADIRAFWYPNTLSFRAKLQQFADQLWHFVSDSPGAGQAQGGVFPAIFGTVLMVLLMSVMVMPLGVITAVWLHEYAGNHALARLVRIAVVNLAGVPSIVYGVFGLGFFVWLVGGSVDRLLFSDALPNPTFGAPGLLWAALTLALLTLPVVIVATEEGLSRIPPELKLGAMALGATRSEALRQITLPLAVPAMLTGLILAVARAAGETAPLMLVGVVKSAPELPVDAVFPWLHLDRQFMHLGFHIYDLAFQHPDADAQQPLVFATALLLVLIILSLNLLAMGLRHRLRERYRTLT